MMVLLDVVGVYAQATQIGGLICGGVSLRRSNQIWDPKSKWKTERYIGEKIGSKGEVEGGAMQCGHLGDPTAQLC
jgi:hypothetical protein